MTNPEDMLCQSYEDDYSALLDGELDAERESELRAHLERCDRCRARVAALRRVDAELAALASPEVAGDLRERLQARIAADTTDTERAASRRGAPPRRRRWLAGPAAAAAIAAAAAVALYLALSPEQAPLPSDGTPDPPIARDETAPPIPEPVPEPQEPVRIAEEPAPAPEPASAEPQLADLDAEPVDDVAVALELETIEDLDVIANLELLEALVALEEGTG